ncbi:MAG: proteasome subunit beta [Desulfurococcales archaeon]|nr:proteasome subunit beta [Desulfurococcales archaeon]
MVEHKVHTKTTTAGLKIQGYVILGADKRATAGIYIAHKRVEKIQKITDWAAITISGLVADAQYLVDQARAIARYYSLSTGIKPSIKAIASYIANILSTYSKTIPYIVQLLIGGYDTQPRLYYVDLFGTVSEENYIVTGSGSPIAIGILEKNYRKDLSVEEAKSLVFDAIKAATERDAWSGEGVDIVVIGKNFYSRETIPFT